MLIGRASAGEDALPPGTHTTTIQWADDGQGSYCVRVRSMIILHKQGSLEDRR